MVRALGLGKAYRVRWWRYFETKILQDPESVGAHVRATCRSGPKYFRRMVKIIQTGVPTWVDLDKPSAIGIEELTITPSTQLRPVAETIAVIGAPVCMHTVGDKSSPTAVIARWRNRRGELRICNSE